MVRKLPPNVPPLKIFCNPQRGHSSVVRDGHVRAALEQRPRVLHPVAVDGVVQRRPSGQRLPRVHSQVAGRQLTIDTDFLALNAAFNSYEEFEYLGVFVLTSQKEKRLKFPASDLLRLQSERIQVSCANKVLQFGFHGVEYVWTALALVCDCAEACLGARLNVSLCNDNVVCTA